MTPTPFSYHWSPPDRFVLQVISGDRGLAPILFDRMMRHALTGQRNSFEVFGKLADCKGSHFRRDATHRSLQ
jgi:hypothetical protein